jgi:hypothetical protein
MSNAERQRLRRLKQDATNNDHSRKLLPVRTPLGQFANSYVAAKKHKISLWTFWSKVMDPSNVDYSIVADSLHDPG